MEDVTSRFATYPSLRDRVVFISGGTTGIGAEMVTQFAAQGARVAFVGRNDEAAHALASDAVARGYPEPYYRHCDVANIPELQGVLASVAGELGDVSVLVNSAANDTRYLLDEVTPEQWDQSFDVNLRHYVFAIQAVMAGMRAAHGGSIVNLGSICWHVRLRGLTAYSTAKAGIEGLTRVMARELGGDDIRVNCVIPGWILTERQRELWLTQEVESQLMRDQCLQELLRPDDVARLVLWLAADDSRRCTGQNWVVDGGWM